jgi:hypothetical protein
MDNWRGTYLHGRDSGGSVIGHLGRDIRTVEHLLGVSLGLVGNSVVGEGGLVASD